MGIGWLLGGFAAVAYAAMCFWIGLKRPKTMFELVRKKLGGKASDKTVVMACYIAGVVAIGIAIFVFYKGAAIGL